MFADDTTLYASHDNLNSLISKFIDELKALTDWCKFNALDINWSKTYFMFITTKRVTGLLPTETKVDEVKVKVVDHFKLLGVTLDNRLNFEKHSSEIRTAINRKLYSIKRLFYLSFSVKIQFFKTFVLPYFDYCLSLIIYYPKKVVERLSNYFNNCVFKLLKISIKKDDTTENRIDEINDNNTKYSNINTFNQQLQKYGLFSFQHRLMNKLLTFTHSILTEEQAPEILKKALITTPHTEADNITRTLRSGKIVEKKCVTKYAQKTFEYFFKTLLNNIHQKYFTLTNKLFKESTTARMYENIRQFFNLFPRFEVN
jgi:hypothetical protein